MARWIDPAPVSIPPELREAVDGHPLLAETLVRRGMSTADAAHRFLDSAAFVPSDPSDLPGLDRAHERVNLAAQHGERIAIWGDFDADGQTGTALLFELLRSLRADVVFRVPARDQGHGIHIPGLLELIAAGARLIVTCDTGVTEHEALARAREQGIDVIVTDHHVPAGELPPAVAVLNPHLLPAGHPMSTLSGVGVAFELARSLDPDLADRALDLVALGMIADVATLVGDTRYLVQRGLELLRATDRPGLIEVYQAADIRAPGITEEHVGFILGPRLNALGRLADASLGVELLTTRDALRARLLAAEVEGLNSQRQWLTKQVMDAALAQIERQPSLLEGYAALVLSHTAWPAGIIGIVAGRLAERLGKPTVLVATPAGRLGSGSGRSVPGVDLLQALKECSPLLERFGGHTGAAGFSIAPERIPELRARLSRAVAEQAQAIPESRLEIDAYVKLSDLTLELVASTDRLAPFGPGNPPLALAVRDLRVTHDSAIGRRAEHRRIVVEDSEGRAQTIFWWHGARWRLPQGAFDLAVVARASDYRGQVGIQVEWLDARPHTAETTVVTSAPALALRDYRQAPQPDQVLDRLCAEGPLQVWVEGPPVPVGLSERVRRSACIVGHRHELARGSRLAIWSLPPGPHELSFALALVKPEELYFFGTDPGLGTARDLLVHLAGLCKFALRTRSGKVHLASAAAATAHGVATVEAGIEWLSAQGQIAIAARGADTWVIELGLGRADETLTQLAAAQVDALLKETAAYRSFLQELSDDALRLHLVAAMSGSTP